MTERLEVQAEIHPLLAKRRSPRAFDGTSLDDRQLRELLEAARWAPSCFNAQPWRFVYAAASAREDFDRLLTLLKPKNQSWAQRAGALICTVAQSAFATNGNPNRHAWHDVGLAVANLTLQATAMDLHVHQMAGFDAEAARRELRIPEGYEPVTVIAVGRLGDPDLLDAPLAERERAPRTRTTLEQIAFAGRWKTTDAP